MQTHTGTTCGWAHLPGPPRKQVVMAVEVGGGTGGARWHKAVNGDGAPKGV